MARALTRPRKEKRREEKGDNNGSCRGHRKNRKTRCPGI
jgi:hypothetical protein